MPDLIFADGFESGNLSAWSSSTGNGDLSVNTAAALIGSYGLRALINDTGPLYVTDASPAAEERYNARFYFDPNSMAMAKNKALTIFASYTSTGAAVVQLELRFSSNRYQLRAGILSDNNALSNSGWTVITNAPHSIEIDWSASTEPGANNGGARLWVDGALTAALVSIDNDTHRIDRINLGIISGITNGVAGTYYFDAFESRRRTYIAP